MRLIISGLLNTEQYTLESLLENDLGRTAIKPLLELQSGFINDESKYSYSILDGFPIDFTKIKSISVKSGDTIILASDGYPVLFPSLVESDDYLEFLREKDPLLMTIYKSTKGFINRQQSFDDRTYVRFTI